MLCEVGLLRVDFFKMAAIAMETAKTSPDSSRGDVITRFDCVWMQTQKSPNDPHIRIQGTNQFLISKYS
jgi:hypothetical protein